MSFTASAKKWRAMGESNGGKVVDNNIKNKFLNEKYIRNEMFQINWGIFFI